jgi:hypothetical protein
MAHPVRLHHQIAFDFNQSDQFEKDVALRVRTEGDRHWNEVMRFGAWKERMA